MPHILSLDVGSTGVRCIVYDETTAVLGSSYRKLERLYPQPGWVEIAPAHLLEQCVGVLHDALAACSLPLDAATCLGITTQRGTFVTWDRRTGECQHNFISWEDVRAADLCAEYNSGVLLKTVKTAGQLAYALTRSGHMRLAGKFQFTTVQVTVRLKWILLNIPKTAELAAEGHLSFGTIDSWLLYELTGRKVHATEFSSVASTGLYDPFDMDYSPLAFTLVGLPRSILPEIRETCGDFGMCSRDVVGAEIPIRAMIADQQSALFGECCFDRGDVKVTMGTGTFVNINTGSAPVGTQTGLYPLIAWRLNGRTTYMVEANATSTGTLIEWAQQMRYFQTESSNGSSSSSEIAQSASVAESVESSGGVTVAPALNGLLAPYNNPAAKAALLGVSYTTRPAHVARAVLEAVAFRAAQLTFLVAGDVKIPLKEIRVDGGVARNDFIVSRLASLLGSVTRPDNLDMTALGAALLAGLGANVWDSLETVRTVRAQHMQSDAQGHQHRFVADDATRDSIRHAYSHWIEQMQRVL